MVKNAFAYAFSIATLSTMGGEEIKVNKHFVPISTILRLLTNKNGDSLFYFDNNDDSQKKLNDSSLNQMHNDNHEQVASRGEIKGPLPFDHVFGFCKTFKEVKKNLGFFLHFKNCCFTRSYSYNYR